MRITTAFSMRTLYEEYRDKNGNRIEDQRADRINGYQVSESFVIEVRDTSVLEHAYALVLAANPTSASDIGFSLQPTNELKTWLYAEAVKDAYRRALQGSEAAGSGLGHVLVIDPTSRACQTDVLARNFSGEESANYADDVAAPKAYAERAMMAAPPPPPPAPMAPEVQLEITALKNPFIQIPPLRELTAQACVVYSLN